MTTSYSSSGGQPEREVSSPLTEVPPQTFTDIHVAIGIEACRFTVAQDLKLLFSPHHSPTTQRIVKRAYQYLMGEISREPMVKPSFDAYEDLDFEAKKLLPNPGFETGFSRMRLFLKDLASVIQTSPFEGAVRNTITIGGVDFERYKFKPSYDRDRRCLEFAQEAATRFKRSCGKTEEGVIKSLGNSFAFFLFWEATMDFTNSSLDKLIAAKFK